MAIQVASVFIRLAADGAELTKNLRKSTKGLRKWGVDVNRIGKTAGLAFGSVTAGIAAANVALGALVVKNGAAIETLGKTSDKLGTTVEGLQNVRFAAENSGIQISQLDVALQRATRRIGEAAVGTGEARGAIDQLGLSAIALARQRPEDALVTILDALHEIENQPERIRLAFKFFDTEGVGLVNLTSDAIREANEQLIAMNGHFSRLDIARVEEMNKSFRRTRELLNTVGDNLVLRLADPLRIASDQFFQAATQGDQLANVVNRIADVSINALGTMLVFSGNALQFVSGNTDLVKAGIVGFLLFGKKGLAIGAAIGGIADTVSTTFNEIIGGSQGKLEAYAKVARRQIALIENAGGDAASLGLKPLEDLRAELAGYESQLAGLQRQEFMAGEQLAAGLTDANDAGVSVGQTLVNIGSELQKIQEASASGAGLSTLVRPAGIDLSAANEPQALPEDDADNLALQAGIDYRDGLLEEADRRNSERIAAYGKVQAQALTQQQQLATELQRAGSLARFKIVSGELSNALSVGATYSKRLFKLNKAANLANAVISTGQAVANGLAVQPFPLGLAMAALAAVKGAAIIGGINKTKFGGGASSIGSGPNSAPSVSLPTVDVGSAGGTGGAPEADGAAGQQLVEINVHVPAGVELSDAAFDRLVDGSLERGLRSKRISSDAEIRVNRRVEEAA